MNAAKYATAPAAEKPRKLAFQKVGQNLYRLESTGGYYALLKRADKQFRRSLRTLDRKLAEDTKDRERRTIPLNGALVDPLQRLQSEQQPYPDPAIATIDNAKKCLATACRRLSFQNFTHRNFRHFFATTFIESGMDDPMVSRWLGHKVGGALAMRVYGHLRNTHSEAMSARIRF